MASSVIIDSGNLVNQTPGMKANPRECEEYLHQVLFTPGPLFVSTTSWKLEGNYPKDLSISMSGTITGHMYPFYDQPACQELMTKGKTMPFSGGIENLPQFPNNTYIWEFEVVWNLIEWTDPTYTSQIPVELRSKCNIVEVRNNNILNKTFVIEYLNAEKTKNPSVTAKGQDQYIYHTFTLNGEVFTKDNKEDFLKKHPGPFSNCPIHG